MKDEIKEINIKFPGKILDYVDTKEHLLELFNYITNLQEDNAELRNEVKELERMCELYGKSIYNAELTDYKSRNKKAIEFIKEKGCYYSGDFDDILDLYDLNDLLNILNGDDE